MLTRFQPLDAAAPQDTGTMDAKTRAERQIEGGGAARHRHPGAATLTTAGA